MAEEDNNVATNSIANNESNLNLQVTQMINTELIANLADPDSTPVVQANNQIKWVSKKDIFLKKFGFSSFSNLVSIVDSNFNEPVGSHPNSVHLQEINNMKEIIDTFQHDFMSYGGNKPNQYKFRSLFGFYQKLLNIKSFTDVIESNPESYCWILDILVKIDKSQYLIHNLKVEEMFKKMKDIQCSNFYYCVSVRSNLPTFIKIDNMIDVNIKKYIFESSKGALAGASRNSDIRVLKYILGNLDVYYSEDLHSKSSMAYILSGCFANNIPLKFTFKRLRLINEKIHLAPYYESMISNINTLEVLLKLDKYYGDEKNFSDNTYDKIYNLLYFDGSSDFNNLFLINVTKVLNIFRKLQERSKLSIIIFCNTLRFWNIDYKLMVDNCPKSFLKSKITSLVGRLLRSYEGDPLTSILDLNNSNAKDSSVCINNLLIYLGKNYITDCVTQVIEDCRKMNAGSDFIDHNFSISGLKYLFPFVNYFESCNINKKYEFLEEAQKNIKTEVSKYKKLYNLYKNFKVILSPKLILINKLKLNINRYVRKFKRVSNLNKKINEINSVSNINQSMDSDKKLYKNIHRFNSVPPRHLMIGELECYKDKEFIIREKADGYSVDCFPNDIEPSISDLASLKIKAEFIEELDLYLIFDVELKDPNLEDWQYSHEARYNYLRGLHYQTSSSLLNESLITSFDDLSDKIIEEKKRFEDFLRKPYTMYRFYPKAAWKILLNSDFIDNLNKFFKLDYKSLYSGLVNYDGFILSPLDGKRELKVKPLQDYSIDLMYKSKNFYDNDGYCWSEYVNYDVKNLKEKGLNLVEKSIFRLIPELNTPLKFTIDVNRFDKKRANSNKIVNSTINFLENYLSDDSNVTDSKFSSYYPVINSSGISRSGYWKEITEKQTENLNNYIRKMIPEKNSSWLDLGCGSSRLIKVLKKYQYKGYLGIDFDINQLICGLNRIDSSVLRSNEMAKSGNSTLIFNESKNRLIFGDLREEFDKKSYYWDSVKDTNTLVQQKFDYIVCNFSITHFICDNFWKNLERLSKLETKFLFNCLNEKVVNNPWQKEINGKECYIKVKDNIAKIKFEIHEKEVEENFLSDSSIINYANKYGWKIELKSKPLGDDLDSYYDWYILSKKKFI